MKIGVLILCLLAVLLVVPATMAQNVEPGNHYSGIDIWQENTSQYGPPPVDPIELASKTSGSLYIFLRSGGCLDEQSRQISIANMDGTGTLHEVIGGDGKFDTRLPIGKYFIVLPKGTGSSWDDTTWKQETADVTIGAGSRTDVSFIGAGSSCEELRIYESKVTGNVVHVHIFWWVDVFGIHLVITNPNPVQVNVDITATLTGRNMLNTGPKVLVYDRTYVISPGTSTKDIPVVPWWGEMFYGMPTLSVRSHTYL